MNNNTWNSFPFLEDPERHAACYPGRPDVQDSIRLQGDTGQRITTDVMKACVEVVV
ncbi:hypothetical protein IPL85_04770 [Candidatus Saccharibacteria bacterium]|nr:MAG: hypothetical protein IPL85_04770 [Candidatus Saccharibacteria bacterium]